MFTNGTKLPDLCITSGTAAASILYVPYCDPATKPRRKRANPTTREQRRQWREEAFRRARSR
jgi:hypothetical protein